MLRFSAIRASKIVTMKGRSNHRLQNSDPLEDWNNGSWTVDCVCGVNFDDGEEMVNCDECGVWVHTRCSRYVKGDDIFVCDKCKGKNNRNDSEETEVAQLLVELPTKTMGMERRFASNGPSRRPFRLWTDIPIEERVHVQGIPGGNPALFRGLSSVFTPELWKCSGYVPKRFNFQYKEFPCWEEKVQGDCKKDEENENPDDKGAGVLFSLSKQSVLATPMTSLDVMRGKDGDTNCDSKLSLNGGKKWEGQSEGFKHMQNVVKERSLLKPIVLHSGKHKKEDMVTSKDRSGKKKRTLDNEVDLKKRISHSSKAVFSPSTDAKRMELCEDRGTEFCRAGSQSTKSKNLRETVVQEHVSDVHLLVVKSHGNPENKLAGHDLSGAICSSEINKNKHLDGDVSKGGNIHVPVPSRAESSPKTDVPVSSPLLETKVALRKLKGDGKDTENSDGGVGELGRTSLKHPGEDLASTAPELEENHILQDFNGDITLNSALPDAKMMVEEPQGNSMSPLNFQSSHGELKDLGSGHTCKNSGRSDVAASSWQSGDRKAHELKTNSEAISDYHTNKADELCDSPCEFKKDLDVSVGSMALYRSSLGLENGSGFSDGQLRYSRTVISTQALPSQDNTKCVGKSSPTSSPFVKSKASTPDKSMSTDTQNPDATAKWLTADASASYSKELTSKDIVRDEERGEMPRKKAKDPQKAYLNSAPRSLYAGRMSQDSASIRSLFDSKDSLNISSKASSAHNISGALGSGESTGSLQNQKTLPSQNKISGSGGPQKAEKFNEINFQPLSKVNQNHMPTMNPPALAKSHMLSDEELALLLHQQLNSSPRVPRVPRVRQAGTLPQLSSPNAVSMLKRSSGSGGKDHSSAYRRRNKHGSKDAFRSSRELDDEVKRTEKVSSSTARQELAYSADASTNRDDIGSPTRVHAVKKNISSASTATASSGRSSSADANDRNLSLTNNSPRSASDDDTDTVGDPVHHTLPGLINEIMSKGRRMTYEELCNAVLPHWHNLRKHNGERYAYSSHSQAVLDCLRNRHEWARLVDRGPKTNSSRKRRKLDAEEESEDSEYGKDQTVKDIDRKSLTSPKEEVPKGKRNARKRRRLALQGRGIKDVRKTHKVDNMLTDDDDNELLSNSSEESIFIEDEIGEGEECQQGGSEATASSDEAANL